MNGAPRIAVVGSMNVDLTTFVDDFPKPGETIFGREFHLGFGGKGANQAVSARLCGAEVAMVARVGDDLFGPASIENLAARGIDTAHVAITAGVSSGVAPIFVDSSGQNRILVVKGANDRLTPADVDAASDVLRASQIIVVQLEVPVETVYHTLRFARANGIRTILNPAPAQPLDAAEIAQADYFIPNETEASAIAGVPVEDLNSAQICARRLLDSGLRRVIITLGEKGALFASADRMQHLLPFPADVIDTSGAGDAFVGSFACFLSEGADELDAVARANLYAALSTQRIGTQSSFVTREEFERAWSQRAQ